MKSYILYVLLLLMGAAGAGQAKAQAAKDFKNTTPEQRAAAQTTWLKSKLSLDDAQTTKVAAINLKYAQQMDTVLKGGGSKLSMLRAAKKINTQKEAEYKQVFSESQYATYEKIKEDMKDAMKEKIKEKKQS